jgi:hypothetical protein
VCQAHSSEKNIIPIYGRGKSQSNENIPVRPSVIKHKSPSPSERIGYLHDRLVKVIFFMKFIT